MQLADQPDNTHHVDSLAASFFSAPWFHSLCFLDRYFRYAEEKLRREEAGEAAADGFSATATFLTSAKEPAPASCDQRGERRSAQQQQAPAHGRSRHGNLGNGRCVGDDPGEGGGGGAVGQIKRAMLSGLQRVTDVFRSLDRNGDGRASAGLDPSTSGRSSGRSPSPAASMPAPFSARPARTPLAHQAVSRGSTPPAAGVSQGEFIAVLPMLVGGTCSAESASIHAAGLKLSLKRLAARILRSPLPLNPYAD